jgi:hypothetical protein
MKRSLIALCALATVAPAAKADVTINLVNKVFSLSNPSVFAGPNRFTGALTGIDWNITGTDAGGVLYFSSDIALVIDNDTTLGGGIAQFGGTTGALASGPVGVDGDVTKWAGLTQVNTGGFTQSTNWTGAPITIGSNRILAFSDAGSAITANGSVTLKGVNYAVPEPGEWAAMGILGAGLGGLVIRARKRRVA